MQVFKIRGYVKLREIKKVVNIALVKPYKFSKGFAII